MPGAVILDAEPGDMLLHCTGVLHGSPRNDSAAMRRTLYLYFGPPSWFDRFSALHPPSTEEQRSLLARMIDERAASGLADAR